MASVYCNAAFNYFDEQGLVTHELPILNAREADCQWQTCGFERIHLPSAVHDWQDAAEVEKVHYDEITAYAKQRTGAHSVLFYPATLRSPAALKQSADFGPIQFVHSDYTESYRQIIGNADHPYHHILQPSMARAGVSAEVIRSASRVVTLQFWRNTGPTDADYPLAVCDARSVSRDELLPITVETYGGVPTGFDSFAVRSSEQVRQHKWYTYPQLQRDEVLMFRAFDSALAENGGTFWTPHSAFKDPVVAQPQPRCSVEMRAICLIGS